MTDTNLVDALRKIADQWENNARFADVDEARMQRDHARLICQALAAHDAQPPPTEAELEAMARAICDTEWDRTQPWEHKPNSFKARYRELARAAYTTLKSMRDK